MKSIKLDGKGLEIARAIASTSTLINTQITDIQTKANAECERISAQGQKEVEGMVDALYLVTGVGSVQQPSLDLRYLQEFGLGFLNVQEVQPQVDVGEEQGLQ